MRSIVRSLFVCLALVIAAVSVKADTIVAFVHGHYFESYGGVVYTHTQPATVTIESGLLIWHFVVYDTAGVYQGQQTLQWGISTDIVLPPKDYDGDGYDDPAVYRASNQTTYVLRSSCWSGGFWSCVYVLTLP